MRLSFSTRGWAHLNWEDWLDSAVEMDFEGIEVYNLPKFPALRDRGAPFHKYNMAATVRLLREKKLSIPCFDTSYDISDEEDVTPLLIDLMDVAKQMQVPYIVAVALTENEDRVRERLEYLLPLAEEAGVAILMKSSGIYADTARLRALMDSFACDQLAALWDIHHPYRDHGESADTTIKKIGRAHV